MCGVLACCGSPFISPRIILIEQNLEKAEAEKGVSSSPENAVRVISPFESKGCGWFHPLTHTASDFFSFFNQTLETTTTTGDPGEGGEGDPAARGRRRGGGGGVGGVKDERGGEEEEATGRAPRSPLFLDLAALVMP